MSSMSRKRPFGQPRGRLTCLFFILASITFVYLFIPNLGREDWRKPGINAVQQVLSDGAHLVIKQQHQEAPSVDNANVQVVNVAKKPWEGLRVAVVEQTVYHDGE